MVEFVKKCIVSQFGAALSVLNQSVVQCPDDQWEGHVGNQAFWHVAYHTLFYTDLYLSPHENSFQPPQLVTSAGQVYVVDPDRRTVNPIIDGALGQTTCVAGSLTDVRVAGSTVSPRKLAVYSPPVTNCSANTLPNSRALCQAGINWSAWCTGDMPTLDPSPLGLTNTGNAFFSISAWQSASLPSS